MSEASKRRYWKLKALGICTVCGAMPCTSTNRMCEPCRLRHKVQQVVHRQRHIDKVRTYKAATGRRLWSRYRRLVLEAYGPYCHCCGESEEIFLELDHINNDGAAHRRALGGNHRNIYRWAINQNFPPIFQILCANCNTGKQRNGGICPHASHS